MHYTQKHPWVATGLQYNQYMTTHCVHYVHKLPNFLSCGPLHYFITYVALTSSLQTIDQACMYI